MRHQFEKGNKEFLGKKHSVESKEKIRLGKLAENNPNWAGYDVKINNAMLHRWVSKRIPKPELCPECSIRPTYDLANITAVYNRDLTNWKYLCRKCHMESDGRMNNLMQYREVKA